jgi:hypothetical protein
MAAPQEAPARFTPEHLDQLYEILVRGPDHAPSDRPAGWHDRNTASARREDRLLRAVDRAIAELAAPRVRRRRARW